MKKISTGVAGLDEMLNGGLPEKLITAIIGPAGSGKTIFSLQFLNANLLEGKKCVYMSVAHSADELLTNAKSFGWDLEPYLVKNQFEFKQFFPVSMKLVDNKVHLTSGFLEELPDFISSHHAEVVILDSVTEFLMLCRSDIERRTRLLNLFQILKHKRSTALITAEAYNDATNSTFGSVEFVADGVIALRRIQSEDLSELVHIIQISKMRWIKHSREIKQYDITDHGIEVYNKYNVMIGGQHHG